MQKKSKIVLETRHMAGAIRRHAVNMTSSGNSSHIGSVLSMADVVAVLYGAVMKLRPENPKWEQRDRFILSKGHAGAGVYAALAERGFFSTSMLAQHYQNGSKLSGHVSHKGVLGVELSTGSLGHGLGVAAGMAYAAMKDHKSHRVFVVMSDGECDEGSNWEASMFAAHHKLSNLVAVVDRNKLQSIKSTEKTMRLEPFSEKWQAFGWHVVEVDGHDHDSLLDVFGQVGREEKPLCVIAHTTKGKGVSFMENQVLWHYRSPQGEEYEHAIKELESA